MNKKLLPLIIITCAILLTGQSCGNNYVDGGIFMSEDYGENWEQKTYVGQDGRKITLNFALAKDSPLDPAVLAEYFAPDMFLIKLTPVNPTISAIENNIESLIEPDSADNSLEVLTALQQRGYEVILSVGEWEENKIGSNCGQYVRRFLEEVCHRDTADSYAYNVAAQS